MVGDGFAAGRRGGDQVRGTKCEVKELGATGLRREKRRTQSGSDAWGRNQCPRDMEAPLVRGASATRMGISIAAFFENFIGTGVKKNGYIEKKGLPNGKEVINYVSPPGAWERCEKRGNYRAAAGETADSSRERGIWWVDGAVRRTNNKQKHADHQSARPQGTHRTGREVKIARATQLSAATRGLSASDDENPEETELSVEKGSEGKVDEWGRSDSLHRRGGAQPARALHCASTRRACEGLAGRAVPHSAGGTGLLGS